MNVLRLLAPLTVFLAVTVTAANAGSPVQQKPICEETKTLDQLYAEALTEGGNLLVYHGGDIANQQDGVQAAFRAAYPKINLTMIVDYSKYHDVRVDNQIKTNSLEADIIALQTLQNYPRWKKQGDLLCYKPAGFSQIYQPFVDKDGCWVSHATYSFSYFYDTAQLNASGLPIPKSAKDLANPVYANHIASTYPHDDDAALFIYHQYIEKYGWEWVAKMAAQNIQFKRGSNTAGDAVGAKQKAIGVAASAPWSSPTVVTVEGKDADSPYLVWGQRMAILKKAPHPAAAKLFLNWIVSKQTQSTTMSGMSSRVDTESSAPWNFPQASTDKFPVFMEDRAAIERLKFTLALYFGEVQGVPSPGVYGLHPRK